MASVGTSSFFWRVKSLIEAGVEGVLRLELCRLECFDTLGLDPQTPIVILVVIRHMELAIAISWRSFLFYFPLTYAKEKIKPQRNLAWATSLLGALAYCRYDACASDISCLC